MWTSGTGLNAAVFGSRLLLLVLGVGGERGAGMELVERSLGEIRTHDGYKQRFLVTPLVSMLVQSLPSSAVLGKLLNHPVFQFSHRYSGNNGGIFMGLP